MEFISKNIIKLWTIELIKIQENFYAFNGYFDEFNDDSMFNC